MSGGERVGGNEVMRDIRVHRPHDVNALRGQVRRVGTEAKGWLQSAPMDAHPSMGMGVLTLPGVSKQHIFRH